MSRPPTLLRALSRTSRASVVRRAARPIRSVATHRTPSRLAQWRPSICCSISELSTPNTRSIHTTTPRAAPAGPTAPTEPASISVDEYHELADDFLDSAVAAIEDAQDGGRPDLDMEFADNILTVTLTDKGTWVVNKQPPNKQIWLSSPISGPKRYDWVGETGVDGDWVYLRDGSRMRDLMRDEWGVEVESDIE